MKQNANESYAAYLAGLPANEAAVAVAEATAAQLAELEQYTGATEATKTSRYDRHKENMRSRAIRASESGRDIAPLPPVESPRRKAIAGKNFKRFCLSYFPHTFTLKFSPDHLKIMLKIESAILNGGLFALAMPRGSGKTTLCETAVLWALMFGHRKFICLIGASEDAAAQMLASIKAEIETNELLAADFPEVCYPISKLGGITNRTAGQLFEGVRTFISWTAREAVFPSVPGSTASGGIVRCAGITGRIRGMKFKRPDGESTRPDLVIVDDPQTDESARSPSQCRTREQILSAAILNLGGPAKTMAGVMPCTVIRPDDMADAILDRDKHPYWQGERTRLVYQWPPSSLWDEYAEIRADDLKADGDGKRGTSFYRKNRKEMDEGAVVAWPQRFNPDEISAIQHAYNLRLRDEGAFFAEYQNEPVMLEDTTDLLTPDEISQKINGLRRGEIPQDAEKVTAFIDIQQKCLFYCVVAWSPNFTGYIIDYGAYPEQRARYYTLREIKQTLKRAKPGAGLEGAIYAGLATLSDELAERVFTRDDGAELTPELILIDANWGITTDLVHQFCRNTKHRGRIMPAHGRYVGAGSKPFSEYAKKKGERLGHNWRIPSVRAKRVVRHVLFDANYWKSFIHARLAQPLGDKGAVSLWKAKPATHRMFADQLHGEYRVETQGRGRTVDEWKLKPNKEDNHFLDCFAGAAVAASVLGCKLIGLSKIKRKTPGEDESTKPKGRKRSQITF